MAADSNTPNKGYIIQGTGNNSGTWGTKLNNEMITYVDINLGGIKSQSLSSTTPVSINAADSRNVIYRLTGTITKDITVTLTSYIGFLIVENLTTSSGGPWTVSINNNSVNSTAAIVPQGTRALLISDADNSSPSEYGGVRIVSQTYTNLVNTFNAGTTGFTPNTATSGAVTLAGTLNVANGGTGLTTLTANNVILGNGTSAPQFVAPSTSGNFLTSNGTTWTSATYVPINYGTAQTPAVNTTNSIVFEGVIPSTAKRITVNFLTISGTSNGEFYLQLGYGSTTYWNSGYFFGGTLGVSNATYFQLTNSSGSGNVYSGVCILYKLSLNSNTWLINSSLAQATDNGNGRYITGYNTTLPSTLTALKIGLNAGNFDSGTVNITWES